MMSTRLVRSTKKRARETPAIKDAAPRLYPCSTKTREVLGNPSPMPMRFPENREIYRGQSVRVREISMVEGNL